MMAMTGFVGMVCWVPGMGGRRTYRALGAAMVDLSHEQIATLTAHDVRMKIAAEDVFAD
jgi:hypothetical protein